VLSQTDCDYLGSKLPKKVFIPNPLAYTPIDNYSDKKNVVLAVGRLNVWHVKGFDILIEAWSLIAKKHPTWSLEIAGDGSRENKQKLLEIIRKFGIENSVVLSGFHNDIDRVMRRSKIFVMSSRTEGFGLTLVEAMSQGCACVSFDCGGRQSEIIRSADEGIILKECNAQALAAAIDNLINNPSEIEQLAQNGVVRSRDYNLLNITNQWETLLQKVAHSARN
jgi:glycosyltransferase involved in cell wall biosynthesis